MWLISSLYNLAKGMKLIKKYREITGVTCLHEETNDAAFRNFTLYYCVFFHLSLHPYTCQIEI